VPQHVSREHSNEIPRIPGEQLSISHPDPMPHVCGMAHQLSRLGGSVRGRPLRKAGKHVSLPGRGSSSIEVWAEFLDCVQGDRMTMLRTCVRTDLINVYK
jgi:hypothetical protein